MRISNKIAGCGLFFILATTVSVSAQKRSPQSIRESCRNLALGFYKDQGNRDPLDAELRRQLEEDENSKVEDTFGNIIALDFDAFLGGNDPPLGPYSVGRITPKGRSYWVEIHNLSSGKKSKQPVVVPEVMFKRGRWVIVNFHYPHYKEGKLLGYGDLLTALKVIREERRKYSK